jgi:ribosomal protein L11 methyltransferase
MRHPEGSANAEKPAPKRFRRSNGAAPLFELVLRVPLEAAESAGALLVEEGMGAAVLDEAPREAKVTCYGEDRAALVRAAGSVKRSLAADGIRARVRVARAPRALDGWRTEWMRDLKAVRISPTLWLVPTTAEEPGEAGAVVRLEPSLAFGFGEHPTTRMAASEVERSCRGGARRVLDFGTGSGVLAVVAAVSGAARVIGLDIAPAAVAAARANAARNGVTKKCRFAEGGLGRLGAQFDLVVANVDLSTLTGLAENLGKRVASGGTLLVTGFLEEDARELSRRYRALGFRASARRKESGWALLAFRKT